MENEDNLELEDVNIIQGGVQSLLDCVSNMNPSSPSIYMVPDVIRNLSACSFSPKVVSIGPLHKEDKNVQAFEKYKTCFLIDLMDRISDSSKHEIMELCMQKVHASMKRIKACYLWTKTYDDAEVAKMMVMDACFILESIYWCYGSDKSHWGIKLQYVNVVKDLILLENQIPFFFLDEIYQCTISTNHPHVSLIQFLRPLLINNNIFEASINIDNISIDSVHHILSLLHQCYKPQHDIQSDSENLPRIHSVIDLHRAGVNFKPYEHPTWVLGMEVIPSRFPYFIGSRGNPTLRMPVLIVNDSTELVLRNLGAFEQSGQTLDHITSYLWAIDVLLNTEEDVARLVDSRVLINYMGSNQEAAIIINNIGNGLVMTGLSYDQQWRTLDMYYNGYWRKHIAWLRRTYFSSPWSIIALLVGFIIFGLTVVQTAFTIKSAKSNK